MVRHSSINKRKRILLVGLGIILLVGGLLALLENKQVINLYSDDRPKASSSDDAKTTSVAPTAQEDFSDGDGRQVAAADNNEGIVQDTGGNVPTLPAENQWTSSSDGLITAYSPAKGSLIKNGDTMSGASSLSRVSFRLIDDVSGVIAQGSLSVVNGKFSGTFNFATTATNGRLDIFSAAPDGTESSNIEIPIRFK